jgi:hypothetical protein
MIPVIFAAIAAGAAIGKGISQHNEEEDKIEQINTQAKETKLQYIQKTVGNYDTIERLLATQTAQATVRGYDLSSPSFNAIQRNSYGVAARTQKNLDTELSISELNDKIEKQSAHDSFMGQIFGDVADFAGSAIKYSASAPSGG